MRLRWILLRFALAAWVAGTCAQGVAAAPPALNGLFQADRITAITLSPDGLRLAYALHHGPVASVVIRSVEQPSNKITVFADVGERKGGGGRSALAPARVLFIGWADSATLVYAVAVPVGSTPAHEELHAVRATGAQDHLLLTSNDIEGSFMGPLPRRGSPSHEVEAAANGRDDALDEIPDSVPVPRSMRILGFDPTVPDSVLVEAQGGRMAPNDVYRIDVNSGRREHLANSPGEDKVLYDVHGFARIRETPRVILPPPGSGGGLTSHMPIAVPSVPVQPQIMRQRFEYHSAERPGLWHPLNQLTGHTAMPGFSVSDDDYFQRRSFPLGFADDPNVVYIASNVGRDTYGIYGLNLTTGQRAVVLENDDVDLVDPAQPMIVTPLVLDRAHHLVGIRVPGVPATTHWFDAALARLQQAADSRFTNRTVEFVEWNDAKTRVLMRVSGPSEPARTFVFDAGPVPEFTEFFRVGAPAPARSPFWRPIRVTLPEPAHAEPFTFTTDTGVTLHGIVTLARQPRLNPPPLVIICPDIPEDWLTREGVDAEAQAFAREGYLTVEVAYRGTGGFGIRHRDAIHGGYDRIPLDDIHAVLRWLLPRYPYDRRRIALVGHGFGAYVALRALELAPAEFRAGAGIDVPADLPGWIHAASAQPRGPHFLSETSALRRAFFNVPEKDLDAISLDHGLDAIRRPVLIIADRSHGMVSDARTLRDRLTKLGGEAEYFEISGAPAHGRADASAILRTVGFLNANVYDYRVDVGKEHEVK